MINGGKDRLYPIRIVEPYTKHLMSNGVDDRISSPARGRTQYALVA